MLCDVNHRDKSLEDGTNCLVKRERTLPSSLLFEIQFLSLGPADGYLTCWEPQTPQRRPDDPQELLQGRSAVATSKRCRTRRSTSCVEPRHVVPGPLGSGWSS